MRRAEGGFECDETEVQQLVDPFSHALALPYRPTNYQMGQLAKALRLCDGCS